jgi:hypothetical protein
VSLFPATPAWLVVLALLVAALAWVAARMFFRWRRNRYRREAAAELRAIESRLESRATQTAIAELPVLVKRVALQLAPRDQVASLSGPAWLAFLDRTWRGEAFGTGPGSVLPGIAYGTPARLAAIPPEEIAQLLALLRTWIPGHRVPSSRAQDREARVQA